MIEPEDILEAVDSGDADKCNEILTALACHGFTTTQVQEFADHAGVEMDRWSRLAAQSRIKRAGIRQGGVQS